MLAANKNVVFLCSEEYTGPRDFMHFWLDTIVQWEKETGRDIHVGLSATQDVMDAILSDEEASENGLDDRFALLVVQAGRRFAGPAPAAAK